MSHPQLRLQSKKTQNAIGSEEKWPGPNAHAALGTPEGEGEIPGSELLPKELRVPAPCQAPQARGRAPGRGPHCRSDSQGFLASRQDPRPALEQHGQAWLAAAGGAD